MPAEKRHLHPSQADQGGSGRAAKSPRLSHASSATSGLASHSRPTNVPNNRDIWQSSPSFQDDHEVIDLTQVEDETAAYELYASLDLKIVGVQYYRGMAFPGEVVICVREPTNQWDPNAIRVNNVLGHQIGHIPRKDAAKIARYMDYGRITIEAILTGHKTNFDCPIRLKFYGTSDPLERAKLEEELQRDKLVTAAALKKTKNDLAKQHQDQQRREQQRQQQQRVEQLSPEQRRLEQARQELHRKELHRRWQEQRLQNCPAMGLKDGRTTNGLANPSGEPELSLEQLTRVSQTVNLRTSGEFIKSMAMDENHLAAMPMAKQPETLKATLLPYQLQGLEWLTSKENPQFPAPGSSDNVQLWKRDAKGDYVNMATNFHSSSAPSLLSGGVLADDMGLGKTLQMISLIMTGGKGNTLIVAPVSVMSSWEQQIQRHVLPEHAPKIVIHHGQTRATKPADLKGASVVITSYGTLASDAHGGILSKVKWRRIVLDEGHTIRNAKTKAAQAACKLDAQSRWVLTGTPIVNNIKDFYSILKFLRITGGLEQAEVFNAVITRPLASGEAPAESILQSLINELCLRRKKDMKFVDLKIPPKTEYIHRIAFWPDEKKKYDALLSEAQGALEEFANKSKHSKQGSFQGVLERLLRLRQTCNHWTLCKERIENLMKLLEDEEVVALTPKNRSLLQQALQLLIESREECTVCLETLTMANSPVITHCKHAFCHACISKVIQVQQKCPNCRNPLSEDQLLEPAPEGSAEEEEQPVGSETKSSKTDALLKILQATLKKDGSKVIIFSQWTSFLNVIQRQLEEAGYKYTRIDGSMKTNKRDAAISDLDNDPSVRIMLASLAVASVGLNLVSADTVVLADSWWAPAIEDQAVDRVHRLGQTRPTTVWRLVMQDTVEERVLDVQQHKRKLVTKAFQEKGKAHQKKETRMGDIIKLLGVQGEGGPPQAEKVQEGGAGDQH
ncbi:putative SWI/SNF-related matrix-associated actin-dependent regulator of chromatin subfamily A member 3-like 1 [Rhypophila decipiens]